MRAFVVGAMMVSAAAVAHAQWLNLPLLKGNEKAATEAAPVAQATGFSSARVRVLDKQTNRIDTLTLKAKTKTTSGTLEVVLGRCAGDLQGIPGQDAAWLDVRDKVNDVNLFSGWMFSATPQVAALDHPRYDIQVVGCGDTPRGRVGKKAVVTDVGGSEDDEAPAGDPYVVEGIKDKSVPAAKKPASDQDQLHRLMDE